MPRRTNKKALEEQIEYTEKILQAEILAANPPKTKETTEENVAEQKSDISVPSSARNERFGKFFKWAKSR